MVVQEEAAENRATILVAQSGITLAKDITRTLEQVGYGVVGTPFSGEEAVRAAEELKPDLILMDIDLEGEMDGIEAYELIRTRMDVPVVYLTGCTNEDVLERAKRTEPYGYLVKPVSAPQLRGTIEIALYKHRADLCVRESEARRAKAEEMAGLHSWEWDVRTGHLVWSAQSYRAFGLSPDGTALTIDTFMNSVHADDKELIRRAVRDALDGKRLYDLEFRIVQPNGQQRVLHSQAAIQRDSTGQPTRMQGMTLDITDRKQDEQLAINQRDLAIRLSSTASLETALSLSLTAVMDTSGTDSAGMYLREHDGSWRLAAHRGVSRSFVSQMVDLDAASEEVGLIEIGQPIHFESPFDSLSPRSCDALRMEGFVAISAIPLVHERKAIGCLLVGSRSMQRIPERVRNWLEGIAAVAGSTIVRISAEEASRRSEEKFRAMYEQCPIAISVVGFDRRFLEVNDRFVELLGYSEQELLNMAINDVSHPDDLAREMPLIEGLLKNEIPSYSCEKRVFRKNGETAWVHVTATSIRDDKGTPLYAIGMVHDLTDSKLADEALSQSEQRFRELYGNLRDGVAAVDAEGRFLQCNPQFLRMVGYTFEEIAELTYEDITPTRWHGVESQIGEQQVDVRGYSDLYEKEYIHKNGTVFPVEIQTYLVRDSNGKKTGYWAFLRDISERKLAEENLRESEDRYRNLVETSNLAIYITNAEGVLTHANQRMVEMTGYDNAEDLIGIPAERLYVDPADRKRMVQELQEKGSLYGFEVHGVKKDGTPCWISLNAVLRRDESGNATGMFGIAEDITAQKTTRGMLLSALREKEALLREIHHRVKNNLAVVSSLLGFQGRHAKDECHRRMFIETQDRIRSMALAHEKLYQAENLSEIDSKDYLTSLSRHLLAGFGRVGGQVKLEEAIAQVDLDLETGITLGLIVTELLTNALKHAFPDDRAGTIALTLKEIGHSILELSVADDGIGLPDTVQLDKPSTLGLDLVRIFSRQLRGHMEFRRDRGTEAILRFSH
jgi:PAS domain S-box-containing protein